VKIGRLLFGEEYEILRRHDFQILLLASLLPTLGTGLLAPVMGSLIEPYDTSPASIGLLNSMFTAPAIVLIPLIGGLADRVGRKPILFASLTMFAFAGIAIGMTTDFRLALGLRVVQGMAYGGLTPIIITSIGDIYKGNVEATAQGMRAMSGGVSSTVFPLVSGIIVGISWNYPFFLYAIALPIAAAVFLWFSEPSPHTQTESAPGNSTYSTRKFLGELKSAPVLAAVVGRAFPLFVWLAFITYSSFIVLEVLNSTPTVAGIFVMVASISFAASASQAGRIARLFSNLQIPLVGSNICLGAGFTVFLFSESLLLSFGGTIVLGFGFGVLISLYRSVITSMATDSYRARMVASAEAFARIIATITPLAIGWSLTQFTIAYGPTRALQFASATIGLIASIGGIMAVYVLGSSTSLD
jgi:MFS family permease